MGSLTGENTFLEARTEAEQLRSRIPVATQPADSENYCTGGTSGAKNEDRRGSVGDVTPPETDVDIDDTLLQLLRRSSICSGAFGKSGSNSKVYYSPASKTHNEKSLVRSKLRNPAKRDSLAGQLRPSDCAHLKRLTHAHLNSLNLSNPPRLSYCRALEVLYLYDNSLETLPDLRCLLRLRQVYLHRNRITSVSTLRDLPFLEEVDLSQNRLKVVSGLTNCPMLRTLYLDSQRPEGDCEGVPENQRPFEEKVDSADSSRRIPGGLSFALETLQALSGSLVFLQTRDNGLRTLSPLACLAELESLDASNNCLETLDDVRAVLRSCGKLQHLTLRGNPLACRAHRDYRMEVLSATSARLITLDGNALLRQEQQRASLLRRRREVLSTRSSFGGRSETSDSLKRAATKEAQGVEEAPSLIHTPRRNATNERLCKESPRAPTKSSGNGEAGFSPRDANLPRVHKSSAAEPQQPRKSLVYPKTSPRLENPSASPRAAPNNQRALLRRREDPAKVSQPPSTQPSPSTKHTTLWKNCYPKCDRRKMESVSTALTMCQPGALVARLRCNTENCIQDSKE